MPVWLASTAAVKSTPFQLSLCSNLREKFGVVERRIEVGGWELRAEVHLGKITFLYAGRKCGRGGGRSREGNGQRGQWRI